MIFFTADTHFGHARIIQYCKRPFKDLQEMDEVLIANWNARVGKEDTVYFLGDFAYSNAIEILNKLNGIKHLIAGSHDPPLRTALELGFASAQRYREILALGTRVVLQHCPLRCWEGAQDGSIHLFGHVHGRITTYNLSMDIGVDTHNFYPYSEVEVMKFMDQRREQMRRDGRVFKREGGGEQYYQDDIRWLEHTINSFRKNIQSIRSI